MRRELIAVLVLVAVLGAVAPSSRVVSAQPADIFAAIDRGFEDTGSMPISPAWSTGS